MSTLAGNCIEWDKATWRSGYGMVKFGGKTRLAHRVAYCKAKGISLESIDGLMVRHSCDNPICVNPDHLLLGTHQDNMADMKERGRRAKDKHSGAKLTESLVREIRAAYIPFDREFGCRALARKHNVSSSAVSAIITAKNWK